MSQNRYDHVELDEQILSSLSEGDLFHIVSADGFEQIEVRFGKDTVSRIRRAVKKSSVRSPFYNHKYSQALSDALTGAPSLPIVALWCLSGLSSIGLITLSLLSAGLVAFALVAGAVYFGLSYRERVQEREESEENAELLEVQLSCARALAKKRNIPTVVLDEPTPTETQGGNKIKKYKSALIAVLLVSTTMLGTYFITANAVLFALGLTSAAAIMGAPVFLGIAVALSLAAALYFGYKQYQLETNEEKFDAQQSIMKKEFKKLRDQCNTSKRREEFVREVKDTGELNPLAFKNSDRLAPESVSKVSSSLHYRVIDGGPDSNVKVGVHQRNVGQGQHRRTKSYGSNGSNSS